MAELLTRTTTKYDIRISWHELVILVLQHYNISDLKDKVRYVFDDTECVVDISIEETDAEASSEDFE